MPLDPDVRALFAGANFVHLATLLPDGSPHSVAIWADEHDDDHVLFFTRPTSRKARNLDRDPRLAISITDRERPFAMAQVRGRVAERLEGDEAFEVIDRLSHKYIGQPYPLRSDRVVYLIEPERAWAQTFG
jgi:PPOX class probable F420-dependent enzyme